MKIFNIGKRLSDEEASRIIGSHFSEISDKLLNVIQLNNQKSDNVELIEACIQQKTLELKNFKFNNAINFSEHKYLLKYLAIPFLIFFIFFASGRQELITESAYRIIDYETKYVKPLPFSLEIINDSLTAIQNSSFNLQVKFNGEKFPDELFINFNNNNVKMLKNNTNLFNYNFINIQKDINFNLYSKNYYSNNYSIIVIPEPQLLNFNLFLSFPNYINKKNITLKNVGSTNIPYGTQLQWDLTTQNSDKIHVLIDEINHDSNQIESNLFSFKFNPKNSFNYSIIPSNKSIIQSNNINYEIDVVPDKYPEVELEQFIDSTNSNKFFFNGFIKDDYGFSKFEYVIKDLRSNWDSTIQIDIKKDLNYDNFYLLFELPDLKNFKNPVFQYYFNLYDNDELNGYKLSRSKTFQLDNISNQNIKSSIKKASENILNKLDETLELTSQLKNDYNDLMMNMLNNKNLTWNDKQEVQNVFEKQKKITENLSKISELNKINNSKINNTNVYDKNISQKLSQVQSLLDKILTDEMIKMMDEIKKMMQNLDKNKLLNKIDQIQLSNEDLEKELNRNIEILKKFEFRKSIEDVLEKLENMISKQNEYLINDSINKKDFDEISQKQSSLLNDKNNFNKNFKDLLKLNSELKNKENLDKIEETNQKLDTLLNQSKNYSKNLNKKKLSKSQNQTLKNLNEMINSLKKINSDLNIESNYEDMTLLRQILDNLIKFSFTEEELIYEFNKIDKDDPKYVDLIHKQNKLREDSKIIQDSLYALSLRQPQIESEVNRQISKINRNLNLTLGFLSERQTNQATSKQQLIMTSANNLAVMLSDILESMQQDIAKKTPGDQQCDKPGSGQPSMSDMKKLQKELMKKLQSYKDLNLNKPNNKGLSEMLSKQEMIKKYLKEMSEESGNNIDDFDDKIRDIIDNMEKTEQEISNNDISNTTISRQNKIMQKLLDAENSLNQRGEDKIRESNEANQIPQEIEDLIIKKKLEKLNQGELLESIPLELNPYFKLKAKEYFKKIKLY
ncbi:MAG: hypothetical protein CBE48_002825 [Flavobacteriales bacterium TMED288]|nr:MAG: hypothetical protein CBE48_002825 [Flavobacteriales bacterium TMED288]